MFKDQINLLELELKSEREEKEKIIYNNDEKIKQLTESLDNIKNHVRHLALEKAKRQHRLNALDSRIRNKVNISNYYSS